MQSKFFQEPFDSFNRIPRLMPKCGHSICESCLSPIVRKGETLICPEDSEQEVTVGKNINSFPINAILFELTNRSGRIGQENNYSSANNSGQFDRKNTVFINNQSIKDNSLEVIYCSNRHPKNSEQRSLDGTPKNLSRLTEDNLEEKDTCRLHNKKMKTVCLEEDCMRLICSHCGLYGDHRVCSADTQRHFEN